MTLVFFCVSVLHSLRGGLLSALSRCLGLLLKLRFANFPTFWLVV